MKLKTINGIGLCPTDIYGDDGEYFLEFQKHNVCIPLNTDKNVNFVRRVGATTHDSPPYLITNMFTFCIE